MSSVFDVANILAVTAVTVGLGYATFWALNVRKALVIRVYSRQALGIALLASILGLWTIAFTASAYLVYGNPLDALGNGGFGLFFPFLAALLYWIDASVLAVRRSDPLSRNILHWGKVRWPLWAGTLPALVVAVPVNIYAVITNGGNAGTAPPWAAVILIPGIFIPVISGAVVLPIISRWTRDPMLRNHLRWFAVFAVVFLLSLLLGNGPGSNELSGLAVTYVGLFACAYCLYRSALALTPLKMSESKHNTPAI